MLQLSQTLLNKPVLSLQTGGPVGQVYDFLIDPTSLKIVGLLCKNRLNNKNSVLLTQDIRDILPQGYAVNDHNSLTDPHDLIRLKDILELNFHLIGKSVITQRKKKIGKVSDFAVERDSMYVQKLYVTQPIFKSLNGGQLSVDRNQIIEISPRQITIMDPLQGEPSSAPAPAV